MAIKTPIQEDWRRSVGEVSHFEGSFKFYSNSNSNYKGVSKTFNKCVMNPPADI